MGIGHDFVTPVQIDSDEKSEAGVSAKKSHQSDVQRNTEKVHRIKHVNATMVESFIEVSQGQNIESEKKTEDRKEGQDEIRGMMTKSYLEGSSSHKSDKE